MAELRRRHTRGAALRAAAATDAANTTALAAPLAPTAEADLSRTTAESLGLVTPTSSSESDAAVPPVEHELGNGSTDIPEGEGPSSSKLGSSVEEDDETGGVTTPRSLDWLERLEFIIPWLLLAICTFTRYYRLESPKGGPPRSS